MGTVNIWLSQWQHHHIMKECFVRVNKMPELKINSDFAGHLNKENIHCEEKDDLSDTASENRDTMDNESGFYDDEASEKSLNDDYMEEEPVSPPPCPMDEAPQLLMSQTIEELAMQVVEETRSNSGTSSPVPQPPDTKPIMDKSVHNLLKDVKITIKQEEDESIPKTISLSPVPAAGPSLIPLTVTEILDNDGNPGSGSGPSTLHMSGGGVYTTDSFLDASRGVPSNSKNCEPSRPRSVITSVITRTPQKKTVDTDKTLENLIKMYAAATKSKPTIEKPTSGGAKICRIPQATIKLSDSLEITPIITRHISPSPMDLSVTQSQKLVQDNLIPKASKVGNNKKRKRESSPLQLNSSSELVIEKIPRKSETISVRSHEEDHDQTYNCKLSISKTNPKKVKLDFGNGIELMLNKSLFKGLNLTGKSVDQNQKSSFKRKPLKSRKETNVTSEEMSNSKSDIKSINVDGVKPSNVFTTDVDVPKKEEKDVKNNITTVIDQHKDENNPVEKISKIPTDIEAVGAIGLHKLPSIISKPSFYSSLNSRKKLEKTI